MEWKSPRAIEAEKTLRKRKIFEEHMELVDMGMITHEMAVKAINEAIETDYDDPPTQPMLPFDGDRFDVFGTDD